MGQVIAFSDLHGNYELWTAIKNYYGKNDTLIFLGDACDRGPDGIKIIQELLQDPRVIYLCGNHEKNLLEYINKGLDNIDSLDTVLIERNGATETLKAFKELNDLEQKKIVNALNNLRYSYLYINKEKKNIFLSHAGIDFEQINNYTNNDLLWNREVIKEKTWDNKYKHWYIVHGHTPVGVLKPEEKVPKIIRYENNHKINIDMGSFTTGIAAALNLDTLQVKYFKINGGNNNGTRDNENITK